MKAGLCSLFFDDVPNPFFIRPGGVARIVGSASAGEVELELLE